MPLQNAERDAMGSATHEDGFPHPDGLGDTHDAQQSGVHPVQRLRKGDVIGAKYLVHGTLGIGGFAVVYDAEHSGLGKSVAIKVMHLDADTPPGLLERFRQEARISALVHHPNVLDVYDTGSLEDGSPYLVMERIEGETLYRRMTRRGLSVPALVEVARQLLAGLSVLAERGIVHRDIKPENIMLHSPSRSLTVVKILDFGISKLAADVHVSEPKHSQRRYPTCNGAMIGTPHYMSPEQIRGEAVDARSDLYALGVVLYEALTGHVPYDGASLNALVLAALNEDIRPVCEARPDCPAELERIVLKAMSRDRNERYAYPHEMLAELERLADALRMPQGQEVWFDPPWERLSARARAANAQASADDARRLPSSSAEAHLAGAQEAPQRRSRTSASTREELAELSPSPSPRKRSKISVLRLLAFTGLVVLGLVEPRTTSPSSSFSSASLQTAQVLGSARANAMSPPSAAAPSMQPTVEQLEPSHEAEAVSAATHAPAKARRREGATTEGKTPESKKSKLARGPKVPRNALEATLTREAFSAYLHGDLEHAYGLYRRAVHEFPAAAEAWRGLGLVATRLGRFDEARRALGRYLTLSPAAVDAAAIAEHRSKLP